MRHPSALLLKVFSNTLSVRSLKGAIETLFRSARIIRRRPVMRGVTKLAGLLEICVVPIGHPRWSIHIHALAELHDFDPAAAQKAWREITKSRHSTLGVQKVRDEEAYVRYATKTRDRCPEPGFFNPAWLLKVLVQATRNVHYLVHWGGLTRRRRVKRIATRPHLPPVSYDDDPQPGEPTQFVSERPRRRRRR